MRIAVTGTNGQLALALQERAAFHSVDVIAIGRPAVDLTSEDDVFAGIRNTQPDIVVNAAAYTAVDLAESEPTKARAVNVEGAGHVARAAARLKVPIIQMSTDYVFDGRSHRPYREQDTTNPANEYGRSKRDGELAVMAANPDHAILRTAWVYSPFGKNFVKTMLGLGNQRDVINVVADQIGAPTNALDIADGIFKVAANLIAKPAAQELRGVFHITSAGETSWAAFAQEIFTNSTKYGGRGSTVIPIPSSGYPTPASRPANSRLDNSKIADAHGVRLPHWSASLPACVERLMASAIALETNNV